MKTCLTLLGLGIPHHLHMHLIAAMGDFWSTLSIQASSSLHQGPYTTSAFVSYHNLIDDYRSFEPLQYPGPPQYLTFFGTSVHGFLRLVGVHTSFFFLLSFGLLGPCIPPELLSRRMSYHTDHERAGPNGGWGWEPPPSHFRKKKKKKITQVQLRA